MTDSFKWDGNVLRGPFKLLVDGKVELSRGPPESAPFNTGTWFMQFKKYEEGYRMHESWSSDVTRAADAVTDWEVVNQEDKANPVPIQERKYGIGSILANRKFWGSHTSNAQSWNVNEHVAVNSEFSMTVKCPSLQASIGKPDVEAISKHIKSMLLAPQSYDVKIVFEPTGQQLWANSTLLRQESPYFCRILDTPDSPRVVDVCLSPVSDETIDLFDDQRALMVNIPSPPQTPTPSARYTVTVNVDTVHTLQAALIWMVTKYPLFHTLTNSPAANAARAAASATATTPATEPDCFDAHGNPLISWQSAYRLAHLFELAALKKLALAELEKHVSVETVAGDLFGELSARHADVRKIAMDFAVAHWAQVKESEGMKEARERVGRGEVEKGGEIAMELAMRL